MNAAHAGLSQENRRLGDAGRRIAAVGLAVGAAALAAAFVLSRVDEGGAGRLYQAYLTSFCYWLSVSLGALFFVILQHLTRSGWSVAVRRIAEAFTPNLALWAMLSAPVIAGVYGLASPAHQPAAHGEWHGPRALWLAHGFLAGRHVVYWAVWGVLAACFVGWSMRQDADGDVSLTRRMERLSAPAMLLFAITITFASFDLLMSRDPHWYSTIFGVYFFSGCTVGLFAWLALAMWLLQRSGRLTASITVEHYYDVGKLLFAFVVFWAYIAFSQYMLIWYGNLPEETVWYHRRKSGPWTTATLALLFGHFVVPFLAMISRVPKRRPGLLAAAAVWMLAMHWLDVLWLSRPEANGSPALPGLPDGLCMAGIGGLFVATAAIRLRRCSLVPERDPRIAESLAFHDV